MKSKLLAVILLLSIGCTKDHNAENYNIENVSKVTHINENYCLIKTNFNHLLRLDNFIIQDDNESPNNIYIEVQKSLAIIHVFSKSEITFNPK
jgi:hypothetical protein